jgi:type II secretory pathway pseudopilin PulG
MKIVIPRRDPRCQRGATLITAMVFMLIFAIMAAAALRNSMSSVQAISNMQWRSESVAAANDAIDRVLSSADFATKTDSVTAEVVAAPYTVDINGDSVADIKVTFPTVTIAGVSKAGPRCIRYRPVPAASLDPDLPSDRGCYGSASGDATGLGVVAPSGASATPVNSSQSMCADTQWAIPVRATDEVTNTSVDVTQGASVRVFRSDAMNYCN